MHMLRADAPHFTSFGEVYFSTIHPGTTKAWKRHQRQTQNLAVPHGKVRFTLYDDRPQSLSKGAVALFELGESSYRLLRIPPMVWYAFQALSPYTALIANCADLPHDPNEVDRADLAAFPVHLEDPVHGTAR
jgi:dTDP-4-dehydrorhamnose 3,5-epimerase